MERRNISRGTFKVKVWSELAYLVQNEAETFGCGNGLFPFQHFHWTYLHGKFSAFGNVEQQKGNTTALESFRLLWPECMSTEQDPEEKKTTQSWFVLAAPKWSWASLKGNLYLYSILWINNLHLRKSQLEQLWSISASIGVWLTSTSGILLGAWK